MKTYLQVILLLVVMVLLVGTAPEAKAMVVAEPTYGTAVVDGNPGEWDLTDDLFAIMYEAGKDDHDHLSNLYVRYDCDTLTAYVLVLLESGYFLDSTSNGQWVKIDGGGTILTDQTDDDGVPPDFAFISNTGWEASFDLLPGATYNFEVHALVEPAMTSRASMTGIPLAIDCPGGSIGDYVWYDVDGEGDQDESPATNGLSGITIRLFEETGVNVFTLVDTKVTNSVGFYLFTGLSAGTYMVDVHNPDINSAFPAGWVSTTHNDPYPYTLAAEEDHLAADFGYDDLGDLVALGDWVWYDADGQGDQNEGPAYGIPCITVWLYDENDVQIGQTNTDSWGYYYFGGMGTSPKFSTTIDTADPDIDAFIANSNGGVDPATCNLVTEQLTLAAPDQHKNSVEAEPTGATTQTTNNLNVPGTTDLTLDYSFTSGPTAIGLTDFTSQNGSPAPWILTAALFLTAAVGSGLWLLRRREAGQ